MTHKRLHNVWIVPMLAIFGIAAAGEVRFIDAVKTGDKAAVRALLRGGIDVNAGEADGTTALHWAAHRDDAEMADLLIGAGANVKAANRYGMTPLFLACTSGNAAMIERLLKGGAEVNIPLAGGQTALMTAARTGKADALKVLMAHGADPNLRESTRGQTALMWASAEGHAAAIRVLIEGGADVHATSHGPGVTVSQQPTASEGNAQLQSLKKRMAARLDAFTPLLFAAQGGHIDATRALLEGDANVNDTAPDGTSALVLAIANSHWELAALLLDHGADVNAARQGWTPLIQLARSRNPNFARFPPRVPTGQLDSLELAKKLIARGADVNARAAKRIADWYNSTLDHTGASAYIIAARGGDFELMRLLGVHGADLRGKTARGVTALMAAAGVGLDRLDEDGGTNEDALEAVKLALELGADVNAIDDKGDTSLHGAAFRGSNPMVQLLIDHGARLDVKSKGGFTPLMVANGEEVKGMNIQRRPWTVELLRERMVERGVPVEMKSEKELFSFGTIETSTGEKNKN